MPQQDRVGQYLAQLTPQARSSLLTELERLEVCGAGVPGAAALLERLRAEFRRGGQVSHRVSNPSRYFFAPLEPLLVNGAPDHANSGHIQRGSLAPIWDWITRDLLPAMANDYVSQITPLIAADRQREARQVVAAFQNKVVKYLESTLSSPSSVDRVRDQLAAYTTSRAVYGDLTKMLCVLRARAALAKFGAALPAEIKEFVDQRVSEITALLADLKQSHPDAVSFAVALVAARLAVPWQLTRLATKAARSKSAADIAATPYAITVWMVLDWLEDRRTALRAALHKNRVSDAREILVSIYDTEYALRVRIDGIDQSDWGRRLHRLMNEVALIVEAEVSRFPEHIRHVLASRSLRSHDSLTGRLTNLAWKGRDALSGGAGYFKKKLTGEAG
jgi:hypothetical protein